jgi:BASS family bile acid:Na+ symporter
VEPELGLGLSLTVDDFARVGRYPRRTPARAVGRDVALNITLTAVNSVLSLATMPVIVGLALRHFLASSTTSRSR